MSNTTVDDWLRSLGLLKYIGAFLDNGYDDLDICKQIGDEDLDAIGVIYAKDRKDILASVQSLKEQGANAVYFQLEAETPINTPKFPVASDREKYRRDELISKMKSLLTDDNCFLPEKNPNVEHDPLNDLAQYYADQLYTYFQDVKDVLLFLRQEGMFTQNDQMRHPSPNLATKPNSKVLHDSRGLSKSLNSLPTVEKNGQRGKSQKSPKHGLGRLFASKKNKNYPGQSLKISGPAEVGILPTRVHMSEEDRKSLMLQVKHGDITQEEALNNFLKYEAHQTESEEKDEKGAERKDSKKKKGGGIFSRSSFKRRSSGHNSEIMASDIQLCEKDRMELMRKIKNKEITSEEAWDQLRRFGNKRDNKIKSKGSTKGSKSPKTKDSRISASTVQLCNTSTFYTDSNVDISQSTSNIPSSTASDSSPDSTPGLSRKHRVDTDSSETLCSSGSVEFDTNVQVSRHGLSPASSKFPKNDVRRAASEKSRTNKMNEEQNRRSTISNSDLNNASSGSLSHSQENVNSQPPIPPWKKPPRANIGKNIPSGLRTPDISASAGKSPQIERKSKPDIITKQHEGGKPVLPPKPALPSKPSKLPPKPMTSNSLPRKAPLLSIANGNLIDDATQDTRTKGEVTSQVLTSRQARKVPPKPSPATRVSRHKPSGTKLLEMIEKKLEEEGIDLLQDPYTNQNGKWGVPMTLVDRYSRELKTTMREVAKEMDHIRVEKLDHVKKKAVPCDISSLRFAPDVVGKLSSVVDWLTSLGLPMYIENFLEEGYDDMSIVPYLSHDHLRHANITNTDHIARLIRSLENMAPDPHSYNGD